MKRTILQKAAAAALFVLLTAALLAAADFLLVDDVHSYSRVMLQELYADAGNIDTLFLGSSHCYRSVDPAQVDAALGTHSFNAGSSQQLGGAVLGGEQLLERVSACLPSGAVGACLAFDAEQLVHAGARGVAASGGLGVYAGCSPADFILGRGARSIRSVRTNRPH